MIGQPEQLPTIRSILPFRSEFRPLGILQLINFSPVSPQYRGNTAYFGLGAFCLWFRCFGFGWCFVFCVLCFFLGLLSPTNLQCLHTFFDDLGTPPTWLVEKSLRGGACTFSLSTAHLYCAEGPGCWCHLRQFPQAAKAAFCSRGQMKEFALLSSGWHRWAS